MTISQLLFSFQGRITRSTFWLRFYLPYTIIYIICLLLDMVIGTYDKASGLGIISVIYMVAAIFPSLAVSVKRCHDRNRSGWFLLVGLIPLVNIWVLIELGFLRGTIGDNQYGPDPLPQP